MEPIESPKLIIEYCLSPLNLDKQSPSYREAYLRLEHVIKTFRLKAGRPVKVDFSQMPSNVINEAAHGYE